MKKYFVLFIVLIPFLSFAVERFELDQTYYRTYYKNYGTGKGVVVAVIDEGVWQAHPDLKGSEWLNKKDVPNNGIDDDKNGYIDDFYGWNFVENSSDVTPKGTHGTAVAGIIASQINQEGIAGIAPDVKIMSLIACNEEGCPLSSVQNAIKYAVNNGANIINLSLGGAGYVGYDQSYNDVIEFAYKKGVIVIASAGNGDPGAPGVYGQDLNQVPVSPVCNDKNGINMIIGVGATNKGNNNKTQWSNYGNCVDVWAEGVNVTTTTMPKYQDGYFYSSLLSGTSFSAPIITGIVAIFKSAYPTLTPLEIIDIISSSTDPYNLNEMTKIKDAQCSISRFNVVLNNGDSFVITGEHFRSKQSFILVNTDKDGIQTRINVDDGVHILDADKISLNTSGLLLKPGVYTFKEANTRCWDSWNSLEIKGSPLVTSNETSPLKNAENGFTDAHFLADNGIIQKQNTNSAYRLSDKVLRQEVIGMAVKLGAFNLPNDYLCKGNFTDVTSIKPNTWACRSIEIAAFNGVISTSNLKFRPEDNITRVEALSILMKSAGVEIQEFNGVSKFSDVNLAWQINVVNTALAKGFIDGTESFGPNRPATRAEIFNMARRIVEA